MKFGFLNCNTTKRTYFINNNLYAGSVIVYCFYLIEIGFGEHLICPFVINGEKQKKRMVFYIHAPSGVLFGFTVVQIITEWGNTNFISVFLQKNLHSKNAPKTAKNLDFLEVFCGYIFFIASLWSE